MGPLGERKGAPWRGRKQGVRVSWPSRPQLAVSWASGLGCDGAGGGAGGGRACGQALARWCCPKGRTPPSSLAAAGRSLRLGARRRCWGSRDLRAAGPEAVPSAAAWTLSAPLLPTTARRVPVPGS